MDTQMIQVSLESQILDSNPLFAIMTKWFSLISETSLEISVTIFGCCRKTGYYEQYVTQP